MKQRVYQFHGGIHPPENKAQSTQLPIASPPLPPYLIVPASQHIGHAAQPLVQVGDHVLKGQMICAAEGYVSAAVHAPSSGTVTGISELPIPHPSGLSGQCIVIETDGEDQWCDKKPHTNYQSMTREALLQIIADAGIVGLGGAGFPAAVKLNPNQEIITDTLIINAAECEPYITADDMLMRERAEQILRGMRILMMLLQTQQCLIGIEENKPEAIVALRASIKDLQLEDQVKLVIVPTKYPSGGEKQLIQLLTDKEVPNGGIPADIGIVCHNVGTCVAIYRAVVYGEPLISRIVTMTGEAIQQPQNYEVLLGTPIQALLDYAGLESEKPHRLLMGGPMMGFTLTDTSVPVIKTTNCILAATEEELPLPAKEQACIRCGVCAEVCPATLLPQQLFWFSKSKEFDKALEHNLLDCIECGACSYVCPSNIPLVQYYRFAKGEIRSQEHEHTKSEHSRQRFEARKHRLEQEAAEKEAKRKQRAAAAEAKKQKVAAQGENNDVASAKATVIQAALERAEAKKAARKSEHDAQEDA